VLAKTVLAKTVLAKTVLAKTVRVAPISREACSPRSAGR
jgi:hypothetical protein